ncbi:MAG: hypothetical protein ACLQPV_08665 [Vulcanimicrobiaceae bacterium]
MTVNVTDYINKIQEESLATLKQAQDANLAALAQVREFATHATENRGEMPSFTNVPTPAQMIERSFEFTNRMLDVRKSYMIKVAELFADAQKHMFAEAEKHATEVTKAATKVTSK